MRWTEKQIETWLDPITRTVTDAGGQAIELEQSTLFWEHFDELVERWDFTEAQLVGYGHDTVDEFQLPFALAIQDAVCHLYRSWSAE